MCLLRLFTIEEGSISLFEEEMVFWFVVITINMSVLGTIYLSFTMDAKRFHQKVECRCTSCRRSKISLSS